MDILKLLKEGVTKEEIMSDFAEELAESLKEYEEYLEEAERQRKIEAARKLEREFAQKRINEARQALGAAMVEYFSALGMTATEKSLKDVELIIDTLPQLRIVRW